MNYYWTTDYTRKTESKPEAIYCSYVIAKSEDLAKDILILRGRGEVVSSSKTSVVQNRRLPNLVKLYKTRKLGKLIHTLCFLSEVFIKSGIISYEEFLNDNGIIHEISHEIDFSDDPDFQFRKWVSNKLNDLDKLSKIFGY
jgi:hypothetical protein